MRWRDAADDIPLVMHAPVLDDIQFDYIGISATRSHSAFLAKEKRSYTSVSAVRVAPLFLTAIVVVNITALAGLCSTFTQTQDRRLG